MYTAGIHHLQHLQNNFYSTNFAIFRPVHQFERNLRLEEDILSLNVSREKCKRWESSPWGLENGFTCSKTKMENLHLKQMTRTKQS